MSDNSAVQQPPIPEQPNMGAGMNGDLRLWELAILQEEQDKKLLKEMVALLHTLGGCQIILDQVSNIDGDKITELSAADKVDNDMRGKIGGNQDIFNGGGNVTKKQVKAWVKSIDQLEKFLKYELGLGKNAIMSGDVIKNMLGAIKSMKEAFYHGGGQVKDKSHHEHQQDKVFDWGNIDQMVKDLEQWAKADPKKGEPAPQLKEIQDAFQTLNQSVSAFATSTNTALQFTTEQIKQYYGILNNVDSLLIKLIGAMVRNQKPQ